MQHRRHTSFWRFTVAGCSGGACHERVRRASIEERRRGNASEKRGERVRGPASLRVCRRRMSMGMGSSISCTMQCSRRRDLHLQHGILTRAQHPCSPLTPTPTPRRRPRTSLPVPRLAACEGLPALAAVREHAAALHPRPNGSDGPSGVGGQLSLSLLWRAACSTHTPVPLGHDGGAGEGERPPHPAFCASIATGAAAFLLRCYSWGHTKRSGSRHSPGLEATAAGAEAQAPPSTALHSTPPPARHG